MNEMSKIDGTWAQNPGEEKGTPNKLKTPTLRQTLMAQVQAAVDISRQTPLEYVLDIIKRR
jgi:hypothetical protein